MDAGLTFIYLHLEKIFVFHNIFHFDEGMINMTLDMIMAMLEDAQVEVRVLAAKTLSGVIRCVNRSSVLRLKVLGRASVQNPSSQTLISLAGR